MDYEQLLITNEMSEAIRLHNQALERVRQFRQSYPYLIAPNVAKMVEENLKENVQMLYRELNNLHKPKTEQRRHVCNSCHGIFAVALRGGLCDECQSKAASHDIYVNRTPYPNAAHPFEVEFDEPTDANEGTLEESKPLDVEPVSPQDASPQGQENESNPQV